MSFRNEHFWRHSSKVVAGVIHVQVTAEASDQNVVSQVSKVTKPTHCVYATHVDTKPSHSKCWLLETKASATRNEFVDEFVDERV